MHTIENSPFLRHNLKSPLLPVITLHAPSNKSIYNSMNPAARTAANPSPEPTFTDEAALVLVDFAEELVAEAPEAATDDATPSAGVAGAAPPDAWAARAA